MKPKNSVSYFPVDSSEQALLLRVREADFVGRLPVLLEMVDLLAEAELNPADLDQAIRLLEASRQGEGMEARFDNLEGRLKERIEKGLAEIEGRLSKRLASDAPSVVEVPKKPAKLPVMVSTPPPELPKEATMAVRIGSDLVWGISAAQFYVALWRWLFEHGQVSAADLPIQSGRTRFTVAATPKHPSGKDFTRPEEAVPGAFVEVNLSRADILRRARKHLGLYGVAHEVVVGSED